MKRLAIIAEDGTLEIGGVLCKVVPVEPTKLMLDRARLHNATYHKWDSMLAAATIDLSGLPKVPQRSADVASDLNYWLDETGWKE